MADMTRSQYQKVANTLLKEGQRLQTLKEKWAEERHGEHELTPLQSNAVFHSGIVLQNVIEGIIETFNNAYANFNEEKFRQAVKVVSNG
jgi:hypothetical protein